MFCLVLLALGPLPRLFLTLVLLWMRHFLFFFACSCHHRSRWNICYYPLLWPCFCFLPFLCSSCPSHPM